MRCGSSLQGSLSTMAFASSHYILGLRRCQVLTFQKKEFSEDSARRQFSVCGGCKLPFKNAQGRHPLNAGHYATLCSVSAIKLVWSRGVRKAVSVRPMSQASPLLNWSLLSCRSDCKLCGGVRFGAVLRPADSSRRRKSRYPAHARCLRSLLPVGPWAESSNVQVRM